MSHDPNDSPSILRRLYDGGVVIGNGAFSSAKALSKIGIGSGKFVMKHTGNALYSASLATGVHRFINPPVPLGPLARAKILQEYNKSYELTKYAQFAKDTAKKLSSVQHIPTNKQKDGTRIVDLFKLGSVGESIRTHVAANKNHMQMVDDLKRELGDISAEHILTGTNSVQSQFLALHDEIEKNSDGYSEPSQIIAAFQELQQRTLNKLSESKKSAIDKIKGLLVPDPDAAIQLSQHQKDFATLCDINLSSPNARDKITEKVDQMIEHIEKEYEKAEKNTKEYFDGIPAQKDTPEVLGLNAKLQHEKEVAEADLLERIFHLQRMMKRGYKIDLLDNKTSTLIANVGDESAGDKDFRARCLHKVNLDRLLNQEKWPGKIWGNVQVNTLHTRNGLEYIYQTINGKTTITGLKLPPQWFSSDAEWQSRVQMALEQYISALKIDQKPGEKLALTINHEIDNNRIMAIEAAYRAAINNGYKPEDIEFTVNGSKDEKGNFKKKPALEVLAACGLNPEDAVTKAGQKKFTTEQATLEERNKINQKSIKRKIDSLHFDEKKDINKSLEEDNTNNNSPAANGP